MISEIAVSTSATPPKTCTTARAAQHVGSAGVSYDMHAPRLIQTCVQVVARLLHGSGIFIERIVSLLHESVPYTVPYHDKNQ